MQFPERRKITNQPMILILSRQYRRISATKDLLNLEKFRHIIMLTLQPFYITQKGRVIGNFTHRLSTSQMRHHL